MIIKGQDSNYSYDLVCALYTQSRVTGSHSETTQPFTDQSTVVNKKEFSDGCRGYVGPERKKEKWDTETERRKGRKEERTLLETPHKTEWHRMEWRGEAVTGI